VNCPIRRDLGPDSPGVLDRCMGTRAGLLGVAHQLLHGLPLRMEEFRQHLGFFLHRPLVYLIHWTGPGDGRHESVGLTAMTARAIPAPIGAADRESTHKR
jgi:hypothetical protein